MQDSALLLADRYELGPVLGEGGMARVHRGVDRTLDRPVAVKVLAPPYDRDHGYVERFRREALAAARLNHPNIVTVFDSGEDAGMQFIVMELVEGETLGSVLRRTGPMGPEEVVRVGAAIADALAEAHARGIVHRDVKPGNVMLTEEGRVKVLDFGIARASGAEAVTRTDLVMGSASYLSPEQAQGSSADERSDVYALGCVLFQMATGRAPFVADDPVAALYQHVNEPVPKPSELRPVPPALEAVIVRALAKAPEDRYASAGALETALLEAPLGPSDATEPMPPVAAEETVPIVAPVVDPQIATQPRPVAAEAPAAPPATPSSRATSGVHRTERSRGWILVAAVAAGVVAIAALLAWADPFGANLRREARQQRQAESRSEPSPSEAADTAGVTGDPDVGAAYAVLLAEIDAAESTGLVAEVAAEAFRRRAEAIVAAYAAGDAAGVDREVEGFTDELAKRIEKDEVDEDAALSLKQALDPLAVAIVADLPSETTTGPTATPTGSNEGEGNAAEDEDDDEHGPPPHSNAGGNGNGNDDED